MAQKPDADLDKLFEGIEDASTSRPPPSAQDEQDLLAGLESLAAGHKTTSRPHTPRVSTPGVRSRTPMGRNSGEGYGGYGIPPIRRDSGDVRRGGDNTPTLREKGSVATPVNAAEPLTSAPSMPSTSKTTGGGGGGWGWGSIWETAASTATAAVKTAEGVVKELQQSEEGKKWAQQVKENAGALRGLAGDVKSRALPTFTTLLHTLAPPISSHEQLRIHITHDLENYPFIDTVVYGVFDRVMQQVEGGDLLVVQRGGGSKPRSSLDGAFGGPWYKGMERRDLHATAGLQEGIKLASAAAESYAYEFLQTSDASTGPASKDNPTRKSNIFLAIQPTIHSQQPSPLAPSGGDPEEQEDQVVVFAIHLFDPVHGISYSTVSQALPAQWLEWLDAPPPADAAPGEWAVPDVIRNIIDIGGIDPREWIVEWVEEAVGLAVGVVAQRYVAKRMRIGDSGSHDGLKGKEVSSGGEEARAVAL
ncbi:maintenance of telomere capping protein 1 [Tuber brumale]|nr:maintenance of telomere capping protein 1 [Tuber brumale]